MTRYGYVAAPCAQKFSVAASDGALLNKLIEVAKAFPEVGKSKSEFDVKQPSPPPFLNKDNVAWSSKAFKSRPGDVWDAGRDTYIRPRDMVTELSALSENDQLGN